MNRPIVADYRLLAAAGILSLFGVAMVYSAGQTDTPTAVASVYKSQILWLVIGQASLTQSVIRRSDLSSG